MIVYQIPESVKWYIYSTDVYSLTMLCQVRTTCYVTFSFLIAL